jgi:hypothetical protein
MVKTFNECDFLRHYFRRIANFQGFDKNRNVGHAIDKYYPSSMVPYRVIKLYGCSATCKLCRLSSNNFVCEMMAAENFIFNDFIGLFN